MSATHAIGSRSANNRETSHPHPSHSAATQRSLTILNGPEEIIYDLPHAKKKTVKKKESEESRRRRNARNRERHADLHKRAAEGDGDAMAKLQQKNAARRARAARAMARVAHGEPHAVESYQRMLQRKRERAKLLRLRSKDEGGGETLGGEGQNDTPGPDADAAELMAEDNGDWNSGLLFNAFYPRETHESAQEQDLPAQGPAGTSSTASSPCHSDCDSSDDEWSEGEDLEEQLRSRIRALCLEIDGMRSERGRNRLRADKAGAEMELVKLWPLEESRAISRSGRSG